MDKPIGIGSTLYQFDVNRRVYRDVTQEERAAGKVWNSGPPLYAEHFRRMTITGETRQSWQVGGELGDPYLVNKALLAQHGIAPGRFRSEKYVFFTEAAYQDAVWRDTHHRTIMAAVQDATIPQLRQIAVLLGLAQEVSR